MKKKKNYSILGRHNKILSSMFIVFTLFMGICYASINDVTLEIDGDLTAYNNDELFISEMELSASKNNDVEKLETISIAKTTLNSEVTLSQSDANSYISYYVTIYNRSGYTYYYNDTIYDENFYDNQDIVYTVNNLSNSNYLENNGVLVFEITFKYKNGILSDNNVLNSCIKFDFDKVYSISYKNITGNDLPSYTIGDNEPSISFTENIPTSVDVYIDNTLITDYVYSNNVLVIPNVSGNIEIVGYILKPNLGRDLIPVRYNGTNWIVADENSTWYDYGKQEWANAVILKSGVSKYTNDIVDLENEVKGIFVWIPRYEYRIANDGSKNIYINFISTDVKTASTGYILPDAFTFGTTSIDGIWFGKFETSMDSSTQEIYVIPNRKVSVDQDISTQYSLGLAFNDYFISDNIDSHMVKNSEWGVVTYLSKSLYGKFGNDDYTGENKEVYVNNSLGLYTGRSGGSISPGASMDGTYTYEQGFVNGTEESGIGASTTGNIYGVYDMSGGAFEYVMGYMTSASSEFGSTSSYNASGFTSTPNSKYYSGYSSAPSSYYPYYGHALWETSGWYGDKNVAVSASSPWYMRGGVADEGTLAGIFAYDTTTGYMGSYSTFRVALVVTN